MYAHIQKVIVFVCIIVFIASWSRFLRESKPSLPQNDPQARDLSIYNRTLGFQEVFALALPDRLDRVQPLLRAANATNITVTVLDAVRDKQISHDAWPKSWAKDREPKPGELGCLTSHVRTWKMIVHKQIASAIIMESDADWDMRIKDIMTRVSEGARSIVDWPFNRTQELTGGPPNYSSPYGDNWDIIWIGHCGSSTCGEGMCGDGRIYRVNDITAPDPDHEYSFGSVPTDEQKRPGTRMTYQLRRGVCSTAYAISYSGAVKLIEHFKDTGDNIDLALAWFCDQKRELTCVGVWPQVITAASSKSNIVHPDGEIAPHEAEDDEIHPGPALQYSARVNADKAIQGLGQEHWKAEWDGTWVMKDQAWTHITFEEAKILEEVEQWEKMNETLAVK